MGPSFLLLLKLVVIKDYECFLRLSVAEIIISENSWKFTDKKSPALRNLNFSEESRQIGPQIDSDFVFCIGNRMGPSKIKDYIINWFNAYVTSSIRSRQYKYQHSRAGLSVVYRKQTPCDWQLIPFDE